MAAEIPSDILCPECRRTLEEVSWSSIDGGRCHRCLTPFRFIGFPALDRKAPRAKPQAVMVENDASCFFHETNRADVACVHCGRYLCDVCAIDIGGQITCASCVSLGQKQEQDSSIKSRALIDRIVLLLAVGGLLIWPVTVVTGPAALGLAIWGWRKPRSLVTPGSARLVVGASIAFLETAAWVLGLVVALAGA